MAKFYQIYLQNENFKFYKRYSRLLRKHNEKLEYQKISGINFYKAKKT